MGRIIGRGLSFAFPMLVCNSKFCEFQEIEHVNQKKILNKVKIQTSSHAIALLKFFKQTHFQCDHCRSLVVYHLAKQMCIQIPPPLFGVNKALKESTTLGPKLKAQMAQLSKGAKNIPCKLGQDWIGNSILP